MTKGKSCKSSILLNLGNLDDFQLSQTRTKGFITLANHKLLSQSSEPIRTHNKYMKLTPSEEKNTPGN